MTSLSAPLLSGPVFSPSTLFQAASEATSTTASTSFETKVSLTTPPLKAGTFILSWSAGVGNDTDLSKVTARVTVDGVEVQSGTYKGSGTGEHQTFSGEKYLTLSAGAHTVALEYLAVLNNAEISNAHLILRQA